MWLNHFENDVIWTAFQLFLQLLFHITVLWRFCRISEIFEFSFLGIRLKTKTRKSRKISIFVFAKFKCIWIYFLITILTFWVLKLKKNKSVLNLINLDGLESFKRQKYDTWIAMWLNHFDNNVIWTAFKGVLELHSYISVFWDFSWISLISEFSFLGIDLKTKTRKSRKISNFGSKSFKCIWLYFLITVLTFWVLKLK